MSISEQTPVQAASTRAPRGWALFTCHAIKDGKCTCGKDCTSPGKHPATPNGFKDASTDPAAVEAMFAARPDCNIAVATGPISGIWVLDVEAEGLEHFDRLQKRHGQLPATVSAITGGGGRHFFFLWDGTSIRNKTKIQGLPIDVRGEGGYVVIPPSVHASGRQYTWIADPEATPLAKAPQWLVDLVTDKAPAASKTDGGQANLTFIINEELDITSHPGATKGERHSLALKLIGSAFGQGLELSLVAQAAVDWARRCTPPMDEQEVLKIVSDLYKKHSDQTDLERDQIEREPLPPLVPWPVLAPDAYYGLAGEIVLAIEPQTEADPAGILIQILVFYGNLIGRTAHYLIEGTRHYCNLFAVLVGSTARGRKGTSGRGQTPNGGLNSLTSLISEGNPSFEEAFA